MWLVRAHHQNRDRLGQGDSLGSSTGEHAPPPPHPSTLGADPQKAFMPDLRLGQLREEMHGLLGPSASHFGCEDHKARAALLT